MGPFVVNNKQAIRGVQKVLEGMNFQLGEKWAYDPRHIISNRREEFKERHNMSLTWRRKQIEVLKELNYLRGTFDYLFQVSNYG